jgi:formamidopyrimidine-DNA glycosylase
VPELPEVESVVRTLAPFLPGRQIVAAEFSSRFVTPGNRKALARKVTGRTIESVQRRGKFIEILLDQGKLTVHLGMTGRLLRDAAPGKHTYGRFTLDAGTLTSTLIYDDPRQFGRILWNHDLSHLGPEPLEVSLQEFQERLKKRKSKIKALLLDQSFVAGVGNIYADETLFAAGVHPLTVASRLTKVKATAIHTHMREILARAIRLGGSSISDYVDAEGNRGWFQLEHNAYGREGEPCKVCGTPIRKITVIQRGTHYCPRCQRR